MYLSPGPVSQLRRDAGACRYAEVSNYMYPVHDGQLGRNRHIYGSRLYSNEEAHNACWTSGAPAACP